MRIAVWHNLPSGGAKRALYDQVRGLLAQGHTVEAWCPPISDRHFLSLESIIPEHVVDIAWPSRGNTIARLRVERSLAAMDEHCRRCASQINNGRFDVLFAHGCRFLSVSPIARYSVIPKLLYLAEPCRWLYEASPRLPWVARPAGSRSNFFPLNWHLNLRDLVILRNVRVQARDEIANAESFDKILVNSYYSRESVLRAYGVDSEVCYLGIDTDHFIDRSLSREDYVVGLGSITPAKNLLLAIEAIGRIPEPRPTLVWIGNFAQSDYQQKMEATASHLGVNLELKVNLTDTEVVDVLSRAFTMIYLPRLEPFGLAPLEANACGTPIIGVHEGGLRETIENGVNGLVVAPRADDVSRAIQLIRNSPAVGKKFGENGRKLVLSRWSLDAASRRLEDILNRFVSSARYRGVQPNLGG